MPKNITINQDKINLLNIGCGSHFHPDWVNIDFYSTHPEIIGHDVLKGLPFENNMFSAVYHSHVLEHIPKNKVNFFLSECHRVLKKGGIIRIVVPDLEQLAVNYINSIQNFDKNSSESKIYHEWRIIELIDQLSRNKSGGEMIDFIKNQDDKIQKFAALRLGIMDEEIKNVGKKSLIKELKQALAGGQFSYLLTKLREYFAKALVYIITGNKGLQAFSEGIFRNSGEIHQWMYDRISLENLLLLNGFADFKICRFNESAIPEFDKYQLDTSKNKIRKPDSIFIEAIKP